MIVVAIIGVLATLGTYGVRKYILSAKSSEALNMIGSIRAAEESYRSAAFVYAGLRNFEEWHPVDEPNEDLYGWEFTTRDMYTQVFQPLGVRSSAPVNYSYAVVAGVAGEGAPLLPSVQKNFGIQAATGPWYIVMAKGDLNGNGQFSYMLSHSLTTSIYTENEI